MSETTENARLETFCDGVFAIALTLLIIDIKFPETTEIKSTTDFWQALRHIMPTIFAFLLSFIIILITWVNHHNALKLIHRSSVSFIYANGFMLLTVVFVPFPTSLVGEYLFTDYAAPAVILYDFVLILQALSWIYLCRTIINNRLYRNERARQRTIENGRFANYALILYSILTIVAFWFPLTIALITTITWIFWLIYGIKNKQTE